MFRFVWEWLMSYSPVRSYKYPWDDEYWKIIIKVPYTDTKIVWSKYSRGWFGLRIQK